MINKTVYKRISLEQSKQRQLKPISTEKKVVINTIVNNFITYLKASHS